MNRPVYACTEPYLDGLRLLRWPGRAGLRASVPTLLPGEDTPHPSVQAAAAAAGLSRQALYQRGTRVDGVLVVRAPRATGGAS